MTKKYTPIGTRWYDITKINGKDARRFESRSEAERLLKKAKKEYGDTVEVTSYIVSHGHTNRDGEHTPDNRTYYKLIYEGPMYSQSDNLKMIEDSVRERLGLLFNKDAAVAWPFSTSPKKDKKCKTKQ